MTENGFYDVDKILNTVVTIPDCQICNNCFHDNKETVAECKSCKYTNTVHENYSWMIRLLVTKECKMSIQLGQKFREIPMNYIYMVDDCLSCS